MILTNKLVGMWKEAVVPKFKISLHLPGSTE